MTDASDDERSIARTTLELLRRGSVGAAGWLMVLGAPGAALSFGAVIALALLGSIAFQLGSLGVVAGACLYALMLLVPAVTVGAVESAILTAYAAALAGRASFADSTFVRGLAATPALVLAGLPAAATLAIMGVATWVAASAVQDGRAAFVVGALGSIAVASWLHARTVLAPACVVLESAGPLRALARAWRLSRRSEALLVLVSLVPIIFAAAFAGSAYNPVELPYGRFAVKLAACVAPFAAWLLHGALVVATWDSLARGPFPGSPPQAGEGVNTPSCS